MAILDIVTYPDERLRKKAQPIEKVDEAIVRLADDMAETMYAAPGIGLAANQVGVLKRLVVIDVDYTDREPNLITLINPEIIAKEGSITWEEGCLSLPGVMEDVQRAERVTIRALGKDGKPFQLDVGGLLAVAVQHEIDHLEGIVFIDHISFLKRRMHQRELAKKKKQGK